MRAESALDRLPIELLHAGPAFQRTQDDHRPARLRDRLSVARRRLDASDVLQRAIHGGSHRIAQPPAFHEMRRPSVAGEKRAQFLVVHRTEDRGIGNLVAVDMQDRQHRAALRGIEKFRAMPCRRRRPGLRLAIADDARDEQAGIVKGRAESRRQRVTEFAAFVNRPRQAGIKVVRKTARPRKRADELFHARGIVRQLGVKFAQASFEIEIREVRRRAVARPGDEQRVEIVAQDDAVEVGIHEVDPRAGAPVPEQAVFHMRGLQRFAQQHVRLQVYLRSGEVMRRAQIPREWVRVHVPLSRRGLPLRGCIILPAKRRAGKNTGLLIRPLTPLHRSPVRRARKQIPSR